MKPKPRKPGIRVCVVCKVRYPTASLTKSEPRCPEDANELRLRLARERCQRLRDNPNRECIVEGCTRKPYVTAVRCDICIADHQAEVGHQQRNRETQAAIRKSANATTLIAIRKTLKKPQTNFNVAKLQRAMIGGEFERMANTMLGAMS